MLRLIQSAKETPTLDMKQRSRSIGIFLAVFVIATVAAPSGLAQSNEELKALRKEVDSLKQGQEAIQKNVQIIRDILSGKQPPLENVSVSTDGAPFQGEKNAKVVMVEFSDFQCPFSGRYNTQTYSQVIDEYVKTGKVKYVFRDFPLESLHPLALKAAEATRCAGEQGKFWEMHDRLFKNQQALDPKELPGHATVLELDVPKFQQCLSTGKYAADVKKDAADGQKLGVRGTPTFFFGVADQKDPSKMKAVSMFSGAQPLTTFKDALDKLLNPPKEEKKDGGPDKASE
jgi:protein-disulfide isomerase